MPLLHTIAIEINLLFLEWFKFLIQYLQHTNNETEHMEHFRNIDKMSASYDIGSKKICLIECNICLFVCLLFANITNKTSKQKHTFSLIVFRSIRYTRTNLAPTHLVPRNPSPKKPPQKPKTQILAKKIKHFFCSRSFFFLRKCGT